MLLALSSKISAIDSFAEKELGIPTSVLMQRSGRAVADAVLALPVCSILWLVVWA